MKLYITIVCALLLSACSSEDKETVREQITDIEPVDESQKTVKAIATLNPVGDYTANGKVVFTEISGEVYMKANLLGVSLDGNHAIHIHEFGDCNSPDGKSAGGHWNPTNKNHGKWGKDEFHRGDIGNITVSDSLGNFERTTDVWCVTCSDSNKNIVGKSIIVHKGPDDFSSQPSGAAGPRIACGVIELVE